MFLNFFINNLLLILLFFWYNKKIFQMINLSKLNKIAILILIITKSMFSLFNSSQINILLTIVVYSIISALFFRGSTTKKVLFSGFFLIASFVAEINAFLLINPIFIYYHIDTTSFIYNFIGIIISIFMLSSFIYLITKLNDIKNMIETKEIWYLIILPIMSIIIIFSVISSNLLNTNPILCILLTFGIIFFNITMCFGFSDIIKSRNSQLEMEKFKIKELHYQLLEEKFNNSRKYIHDFNKHINIINGFVAKKEYYRLSSYLKDMTTEINNENNLVVTGNPLIDIPINANKNLLSKHSITIRHNIKVIDIFPITDLDFNIVFSNILENAIESCINTNSHLIKIKLDEQNNIIILKVINSYKQIKKNLETTKQDHDYHGIGIKNIERIAKKYNGKATFESDPINNLFISTVYLEKHNNSL